MKNKIMILIGILGIILGIIYQVWRFHQISQELNISFIKAIILFSK